jgi:hypothetical protein
MILYQRYILYILYRMQVLRTRLGTTPPPLPLPLPDMQSRQAMDALPSPIPVPVPAPAAAAAAAEAAVLDNRKAIVADTSELEHSFLTMGLKSKVKKDKTGGLQLRLQRSSGGAADGNTNPNTNPNSSKASGQSIDADDSADVFGQLAKQADQDQASFGEFDVYSAHTPFVSPLRVRSEEAGGGGAVSQTVSSFLSPPAPAPASGVRSTQRGSELRSRAGHWTTHTFSTSAPQRAGPSKWSVGRAGAAAAAAAGDKSMGRSPFVGGSSAQRRPQPESEETVPIMEKRGDLMDAESAAAAREHDASVLTQQLLDRLSKGVSGVSLCIVLFLFLLFLKYYHIF